jgi:hypothetical protein
LRRTGYNRWHQSVDRKEIHEKLPTGQGGTMAGKFEIKKAKDGQFYFHLKAGNGEKILASEMYRGKRLGREWDRVGEEERARRFAL